MRLAVIGGVAVAATLVAFLGPSYAANHSCVADPLPASDQPNYAWAVSFDAPGNGWIVGASGGPEPDCESESAPWAEHWDGKAWTDESMPTWDCRAALSGVAAISPTNAWVVGNGDFQGVSTAFHWNGSQWVEKPLASGYDLSAVDATAHSHVWAAGRHANFATVFRRAHGDWVAMKAPRPAGAGQSGLTDIAVLSDTDVWAVGWTSGSHALQLLVVHWNGQKWTLSHLPNASNATLTAVAGRSARDVWAVGYYFGNHRFRTLTEHWDGTKWTRIPTPSPGLGHLNGVAVNTHGGAWAVGYVNVDRGPSRTLVLRWDGSKWSVATSPNPNAGPNNYDSLVGVTPLPKGHAYAIGYMPADPNATSSDEQPLAMTC